MSVEYLDKINNIIHLITVTHCSYLGHELDLFKFIHKNYSHFQLWKSFEVRTKCEQIVNEYERFIIVK